MEIFSARSRAITQLALAGALTLGSLGLPKPVRAEEDSQPCGIPSESGIFYDEGLCRGGCTTEVEVTVYVDTEGSFDGSEASVEENPDRKPTEDDSSD